MLHVLRPLTSPVGIKWQRSLWTHGDCVYTQRPPKGQLNPGWGTFPCVHNYGQTKIGRFRLFTQSPNLCGAPNLVVRLIKISIQFSFRQNAQSMEELWYLPVCVGGVIAWPRIHCSHVHTDQMMATAHKARSYETHKKLWDSWPILLKHAWASIDETVSLLLSRSVTDHLTWHEQCFIQCSQSELTCY